MSMEDNELQTIVRDLSNNELLNMFENVSGKFYVLNKEMDVRTNKVAEDLIVIKNELFWRLTKDL